MSREILGYIDCPHCGEGSRMRITPDKSGAPFGYCEECNGQLRIGGNARRVESFYARNQGVKRPGQAAEIAPPATSTAAAPEKKPAKKPEPVAEPAPAKVAAPKKLSIFEQLAGVTHG